VTWVKRIILIVVLLGTAYLAWTFFFPSHERLIRKQFQELEKAASFSGNEGELAKVSNAGTVAGFFAQNASVLIDVRGYQQEVISGRDEIFRIATGIRTRLQSLSVEFLDIVVRLADDKHTATVNLTTRVKMPGQSDPMIQELEFQMIREGREWLIQKVVTVRTLR
jgi:hypothetical protein